MIPQTGVAHQIYWNFNNGDLETLTMRLQIVTSDLPSANLPQSLKHYGARKLCYLDWELDAEDVKSVLKLKNRRFYWTKPKYWEAEMIVRF